MTRAISDRLVEVSSVVFQFSIAVERFLAFNGDLLLRPVGAALCGRPSFRHRSYLFEGAPTVGAPGTISIVVRRNNGRDGELNFIE